MALSDVTTDFANILNRRDLKTGALTTFVQQGLMRIQRQLRIPSMERATLMNADYGPVEAFQVPVDLLQIMDVTVNGKPVEHKSYRQLLQMMPPAIVSNALAPPAPGPVPPGLTPASPLVLPRYYARLAASLFFHPVIPKGAQAVITYYGALQALVNPGDENEITRAAPDLLVYAALSYAADYFQMDQKASWEATFTELLTAVQDEANQLDALGGAMVVQSPHWNY